jgi:hypothetical protein
MIQKGKLYKNMFLVFKNHIINCVLFVFIFSNQLMRLLLEVKNFIYLIMELTFSKINLLVKMIIGKY